VLETGFTNGQAVAQVASGRTDLLSGVFPTDVDRLRTRYGSQLHTTPGIFTQYLYLDANMPPFNNLDARRAVAYAIDRRALTDRSLGRSAPVTCQLIPPDFAGYQPYCPYTVGVGADGHWTAPDLATAQKLVRKSGTHGAKVVVSVLTPFQAALGRDIVAILKRLDYHATLDLRSDYRTLFGLHNDVIVGVTGWGADYPATSNYLGAIASCDPQVGFFNLSHYCNKEIDAQIKAALAQQVLDPGGASGAWTHIDREVVDAAAVIPFGNDVGQDFVSRRVGNLLVHPLRGPLIDQMWVQ
jgi:peptide/nickel transport system substrate-binding protein